MPRKKPVLKHSEVVFMYAADDEAYTAYGATFVGWGGAHSPEQVARHHRLGVRCTGTMWCLTAGAKLLHEQPALREAVVRDIEGKPVAVPWLFDHVHEGQVSWFGCTNNPTFRELCRQRVREAMAGGADGLHVDDHAGTANAANFGGGFCDHCMAGFREYLKANARPAELRNAGVRDIDTFDYRTLVRKYATTREKYMKVRDRIPLMKRFTDFHFDAAAAFVRELGRLASQVAGHKTLLSANAYVAIPYQDVVLGSITHAVSEIPQSPALGARGVAGAIKCYELATRRGRPMAATAAGHDWTFVKEHACYDLVRFWIAAAYAHGQRFMCPHPSRQWCFDKKIGTHWYAAPIEEFAPVYRFIRRSADCFDGLEAVRAARVRKPRNVITTVRRKGKSGRTVLHVLNADYDEKAKVMRRRKNVRISLPKKLLAPGKKTVRLLSYGAPPRTADVTFKGATAGFVLGELGIWTVCVLK
jgi:hypothetical protein